MTRRLAGAVLSLGVVVAVLGAGALSTHGIIADETRISGWNPWLWGVLLTGAVIAFVGLVQLIASFSTTGDGSRP
jgi:hypothetical protein